ncbi:MAG: hypothetical protein LBV36_03070 [Chromatiales bacterium]|nr:hypothetical protein [Chromatiales bacterium]
MSKILKALTVGSVVLMSSGAYAAATTTSPFGGQGFGIDNGLSITGTTVSVPCPTGATCVNFEGGNGTDGFLQRRVTMGNGTSYLQMVLAEGDVSNQLFAVENVVKMGVNGAQNGTNIAQKMRIVDNTGVSGYQADHTMLGAEYYTNGPDLLFGLDQRISTLNAANAMDQLTRIVGEITGTAGNLDGTTLKRVAIDQWAGANEPGAGPATPAGYFVYRTGRNTGLTLDLEDPTGTSTVGTPVTLAGLNSMVFIQSRQTADTGLSFQRVRGAIANAGTPTNGGNASRAIFNGDQGPWDWNGSGADAANAVSAVFGSYTDQSTSAINMW